MTRVITLSFNDERYNRVKSFLEIKEEISDEILRAFVYNIIDILTVNNKVDKERILKELNLKG